MKKLINRRSFLKAAGLTAMTTSMASVLTACGASSSSTATDSTATDSTATDSTAADSTAATKTIKVGMVTDVGGVNDGSFNQSSWAGLERAAAELGIEANYLESQTDADYAANIETFVDEEYDLIICVGFMLATATHDAAEAYPEQKFAIIDDASCADLPNVACLMFEASQASYLVGYVAGLETESNNVGFVLGMGSPMMHEFGYGFTAGVLDANPDCKVNMANANSFGDPAMGKSLAVSMITDGADVMYHAAGGTGLGVIEAASEAGIKAIGVDTDQSSLAPETIIISALKRVDNASFDIAKTTLEGNYAAGLTTFDITTGGIDITPENPLVSDEALAAVEEVKAKMLAGEITVPKDQASFEAVYGADVYALD